MGRIAFGGVALILLVITLFFFPPVFPTGELGLCLPSPNTWNLLRGAGWFANAVLIFLSAAVIGSANKKYNFIPEAEPIMPLALVLLAGCNAITTASLSTSTLLLFSNVLCLFIVFSTYEERNATREFFVIATFPSIGSMFQYAFLIMIPVYIGAGLLMKSFRIREFIAFVAGLVSPYWIAMGLGLVSPDSFRLPGSLILFSGGEVDHDIFLTLLSAGIMAIVGFILSLYNGVRLFSRNSRLRCMHMSLNLLGYVSVLAIIFDFTNFTSYFGSLALWTAIEIATTLYLYDIRRPQLALLILLASFLPLYFFAL